MGFCPRRAEKEDGRSRTMRVTMVKGFVERRCKGNELDKERDGIDNGLANQGSGAAGRVGFQLVGLGVAFLWERIGT